MSRKKRAAISAFVVSGLATLAGAGLTGCGAQQFQTLATTQKAAAPGSLQIEPKVDVVLVEDDTGRIQDNYGQINQNAQDFLGSLDSQGWNYHFATLRLTTPESITQAASSKQDPNWARVYGTNTWAQNDEAYPGETNLCVPSSSNDYCYGTIEDTLNPNIFSTISYFPGFNQYAGFLQQGQATNVLEGSEPGFYTMAQDFASSFNGTGFFRPDALLAVVLVGTGNDTSYVNMCWNGGVQMEPCEQVLPKSQWCTSDNCMTSNSPVDGQTYPQSKSQSTEWATGNQSFNYFLSQIETVKASSQQIKFYAATAGYNSYTSGQLLCAGGHAQPGTRYQQMASALGGQSYDVCSQPLSSILTNVAQNLTTTAMDYVQGYILLTTATQEQSPPDTSSIVVTKYIGGDPNNAVNIPQDPNNGWEFAGDLNNQPTIIQPVPMNYESGYMLQLNGAAQLSGADYATVTYKMANGQSGN